MALNLSTLGSVPDARLNPIVILTYVGPLWEAQAKMLKLLRANKLVLQAQFSNVYEEQTC